MKKRAIIETLGCKVNQLESAAIATALEDAGISIVTRDDAEIVILNTCAVTATAAAQSRRKLRQLLRKNPHAKIYLTGCHAEEAASTLAAMPEVQNRQFSLFGNSHKDGLAAAVIAGETAFSPGKIMQAKEISRLPISRFPGRSRAYLRIQDGCQAFCSYCIVPYTRGPSRSLPKDDVLRQAELLAKAGHRELVLTGIHLGLYGADLSPQENFVGLLAALTNTFQGRLRISSLESVEITSALLELMRQNSAICPHLHIPLQSGCDKILAKMNRRYTTAQFAEVITNCHKALAELAIGIDILAGFPGESEEDFAQSLAFVEQLDICYLHVFPYSKRPGTPAADFPQQIPPQEKKKRAEKLRSLGKEKKKRFYKKQLGTIRPVLFEGRRDKNGLLKGVSDNYLDVRMKGADSLLQHEIPVRLVALEAGYVIGQPAE